MLYRLLIGLFIITGSNLPGSGQTLIGSIYLRGNKALTTSQLGNTMKSREGSAFSHVQLVQDLRSCEEYYHREGYSFARIRLDSLCWSGDSLSVDIYLDVFDGMLSRIIEVTVDGNTALQTEAILSHFETRPGNVFHQLALERDFQYLIASYERIGYPFVEVHLHRLALMEDTTMRGMLVEIAINEGPRIVLTEIRVAGNTETHDDVIVRETRIAPNEVYNEDKVAKISQRLKRLNIFSSVQEPQVYVNSVGGGLLLTVQEGNTNTFDGIIGYFPGAGSEQQGFFAGLINVSMRNLFGTGRRVDVQWQREGRQSQEVGVQFNEPWLFGLPVNLTAGFVQRQQDSIFVRRAIEARAAVMFSEALSISGNIAKEDVIPSSSLTQQFVSNSQTLYAGVELLLDNRDDVVSPASGVRYRTGYQIGTKKSSGVPGVSPGFSQSDLVQRISLDAELYTSPFLHQVILFGIHGRQITSNNIELSDRFRFGGTNSLRGYRENQFLGSRIAWTNAEYRFLLARRSFFYLFIDNGYFYVPPDEVKLIVSSQAFKYGFGIGLRLDTSLGNIGVSFALGEGNSFNEAKIHVGLMNDF